MFCMSCGFWFIWSIMLWRPGVWNIDAIGDVPALNWRIRNLLKTIGLKTTTTMATTLFYICTWVHFYACTWVLSWLCQWWSLWSQSRWWQTVLTVKYSQYPPGKRERHLCLPVGPRATPRKDCSGHFGTRQGGETKCWFTSAACKDRKLSSSCQIKFFHAGNQKFSLV